MCIRDSATTRFASGASPNPEPGAATNAPPTAASDPAATDACLLYTSDAADERSSVDLGGRRIIKKKKQITTER